MVQLKRDIEIRCREGGDRIIDGPEIKMLNINESCVEMLVLAGQHSLAPKIARLKSRTATLEDFADKHANGKKHFRNFLTALKYADWEEPADITCTVKGNLLGNGSDQKQGTV